MKASNVYILAVITLMGIGFRYWNQFVPPQNLFYAQSGTHQPLSDAQTWYLHALNAFEGRGLGDTIHQFTMRNFVPPGHPFTLSMFMQVVGTSYKNISLLVFLLSCTVPILMYLWVSMMFDRRTALISAVIAAMHPYYVRFSSSLMAEPMSVFFSAFALMFCTLLIRFPSLHLSILSGLMIGFAGLIRPAILPFLLSTVFVLAVFAPLHFRKKVMVLFVFILFSQLPPTLWKLRNHEVHGEKLASYSSISVRHLWTGANPEYGPYFYSRGSFHDTLWSYPLQTEADRIKRLNTEAGEFIKESPLSFFKSTIWRTGLLFPEREWTLMLGNIEPGFYFRLFPYLIFTFCFAGYILYAWKCGGSADKRSGCESRWLLFIGIAVLISFYGAGVYGATNRYRWPLEFSWIPFAAFFFNLFFRSGLGSYAPAVSSPPGRLASYPLYAFFTVCFLHLFYLGHLTRHPKPIALSEDSITQEAFISHLGRLVQQSASMEVPPPSYEDVFLEQTKNFGELTHFNGAYVAWWGIVRFPVYNDSGHLAGGQVIVHADDGTLGDARLLFSVQNVSLPPEDFENRPIRFLAKLRFQKRSLASPALEIVYAEPGIITYEN